MSKIFFLAAGMFALGLDAYVIAGLLPGITHSFGISSAEAAQAVTVFTLCYAIAAPVFATLLSGKPVRRVLVVALAVFSLANAASALAGSLTSLLIARAVAGLGAGLFSPIAVAAAATLVPAEQKGRALGLTLGGMSTGTVIGVPIGLLISDRFGWQGALWLVTGIGVIGLFGVFFGFPNVPVNPPPSLKQRLAMVTNGRVAATVGISFLTAVASLGLYTYVSPILQASSGIQSITPYLWLWGVGGVIGSFTIGSLIDKTGKPGYLLTGILSILTLALFSIPTAIHLGPLAFLPFLLWGAMGWASLAPQQHALLALQPEHGAAAVALNSSCNYLGSAVGTMLGGALIVYGFNPSKLPYFAGMVALAALAGHLLIQIMAPKHRGASDGPG
ncbi:MAG: MFS transporter [Glaciimonas sp.]|nr:MFS transporter [Glaciimonas sp.]